MSEGPRDVSVVICAHSEERWDDLCRAVESLRAQTLAPAHTIVVVDHNPALLARARAALHRETVVPSTAEPGLAGARNEGLALAVSEIVAFLDDDAVADADWLERLAAVYEDDRVVAAGGRVDASWDEGRPRWYPREFDWVIGCTYEGMPAERSAVRNVIGANMSFRRDALGSAGAFRQGLGRTSHALLGCEETDACIRLRQARPDALVVYEPAARVRHRVPASRGVWSYFRSRCFAEGVSKARLADLVGSRDGLSSERRHALVTLPAAVASRFGDTVTGRDAWGVVKAGAIVAGLAVTAAGYAFARLERDAGRPA